RFSGASNFLHNNSESDKRIAKIVAATAFKNAGELTEEFSVNKSNCNLYFDYLQNGKDEKKIHEKIALAQKRLKDTEAETAPWDPKEVEIRKTLMQFERQLLDSVYKDNF